MNRLSSRIRRIAAGAFVLLASTSLLAQPSARTNANLVFDETLGQLVLFGGVSPAFVRGDLSVARARLDETWVWTGRRWVQRFFEVRPPARSGAAMVWDSVDDRILLFGGSAQNESALADTWQFRDGAWSRIDTPAAPPARRLAGYAFDPIRGRFVLFGGSSGESTNLRDTWEFDGTTWVRTVETGPEVFTPILVWDDARDELLLIGTLANASTGMFRYVDGAWEQITPANLPPCVSLANMVWQEHDGKVILVGGVCANGSASGETWEWDGTNWAKVTTTGTSGLVYGHALAYDAAREETIQFGGTEFNVELADTFKYRDGRWRWSDEAYSPGPRSLFSFVTDPLGGIWLFGGLNAPPNLWKYQAGNWSRIVAEGAPTSCPFPAGVWDSDRSRLVIICEDSSVFEFDGTAWQPFAAPTPAPAARRWSGVAYDPNLKKTVLYGGWDGGNYVRQTWTWDGARWTEVKGDQADYRALPNMFYDPVSKKIVLYGGIGRTSRTGTLIRFDDTWSFNGTAWTKVQTTNPELGRYGAFIGWNPADGKIHMFGGKSEQEEFLDEHWTWDGSRWTQVTDARRPDARMNGGLAWDSSLERFTLYGGFAGYYLSDLWIMTATGWEPVEQGRQRGRRVETPFAPPGGPSGFVNRGSGE